MIQTSELAGILAAPAESVTLDFKQAVNWSDRRASLELIRDIVCLANRNGGLLVFGVADRGGRFDPIGLPEGDSLPDASMIGRLASNHFDPPPVIEAAEVDVDGRRFGVIQIDEFRRLPHICKRIGQAGDEAPVFRPGDVVRRTDALECSRVASAEQMGAMVEAAVAKTGAVVRGLLGSTSPRQEPPGEARATSEGHRLTLDGAVRYCDLSPDDPAPQVRPQSLAGFVSEATVMNRYGRALIPRNLELDRMQPSEVVREADRIIAATSRGGEDSDERTSVIEVTTALEVRLRERLWESEHAVDVTSLVAFVLGSLAFAQRFYESAGVQRFRISIGLASASGHVLTADSARFHPLMARYVVTSSSDTLVDRTLETQTLADIDQQARAARDIVTELTWYFGFDLADASWEAQLAEVRRHVDGV